jgi:effector-binding domain-containing protein
MDYHVERVELREQPAAVVRGVVPAAGVAEFLGGVFGEVMRVLSSQGLRPDGMPFGCYVPTPDGLQVEAGFPTSAPVEPAGRVAASSLPAGAAIQVMHRGPYSEVPAAYRAAEAWLVDNGWEATGPPWETYLDGPEVVEPRTVVHVPCRPGAA